MITVENVLKMIKAYRRFWELDKKYSDLLGDDNEVYREIDNLHRELQAAWGLDDEVIESILDIDFNISSSYDSVIAETIVKNKERLV